MNSLAEIEEAIDAHARWMSQLRQAVLEAATGIEVEHIRADDQCDLGRWLYGPSLSADDRATNGYQEVRRLHADFHQLAAQVVTLAASGKTNEAYSLLYGEYVTMSGRLALCLRAWQEDQQGVSR